MGNKVDQSGFQLDKKELLKEVPLVAKGIAGALIDFVNALDINKDGKADIGQMAKLAIALLPIAQKIIPYINVDKFIAWFINHDFIDPKHRPAVEAAVKLIIKTIAEHK